MSKFMMTSSTMTKNDQKWQFFPLKCFLIKFFSKNIVNFLRQKNCKFSTYRWKDDFLSFLTEEDSECASQYISTIQCSNEILETNVSNF